jgi:hypothetical protein
VQVTPDDHEVTPASRGPSLVLVVIVSPQAVVHTRFVPTVVTCFMR